ncbi:hypothetical protein CDAR_165741 [Caerostris darwini]|uniref:Uncharacterized protein n=1 Tax=Caerostris darwini TaxID=1538125 RepID=A0AAV4UQA9_9ARAC|nr:hypothetical protein CDAR_38491 [Caerostris darwini]GIY78925.1 hypothetical protein CDAR_165741 [Caerostris darwini]
METILIVHKPFIDIEQSLHSIPSRRKFLPFQRAAQKSLSSRERLNFALQISHQGAFLTISRSFHGSFCGAIQASSAFSLRGRCFPREMSLVCSTRP